MGGVGRWAAHLGYDPTRDHNVMAIAFDLPASPDVVAQRQRIWESVEHFRRVQRYWAIAGLVTRGDLVPNGPSRAVTRSRPANAGDHELERAVLDAVQGAPVR